MTYIRDPRHRGVWESDGASPFGKYKADDGTLHDSPQQADEHDQPTPSGEPPLADNPSGMYCPACRSVGMHHCSDPEHCGQMIPMRQPPAEPSGEPDTSDIPEVKDWSKAEVGKFYRPPAPDWAEVEAREYFRLRAATKSSEVESLAALLRRMWERVNAEHAETCSYEKGYDDAVKLHDKRNRESINAHLKDYPNKGACEWNCTAMTGYNEFEAKVREQQREEDAKMVEAQIIKGDQKHRLEYLRRDLMAAAIRKGPSK